MNITQSILKLYPTLDDNDFIVEDNWSWPELKWLNEEIVEPTQEELETAWSTVDAKLIEEQRQSNIEQDIIDTIIEFTTIWGETWKFKITDASFWPILWQFLQVKEDSIVPINVIDCTYKIISFTYQDFLDFKALVSDTQTAIIVNNS